MERIFITKYSEIKDLFGIKQLEGYSQSELAAAGPMPAALHYFYSNYGRSKALHELQDELILPNRYPQDLKEEYLIFFEENQGVCEAGIKKTDRTVLDPPVYVRMCDGEWQLSSPSVSDFLVAMFSYQGSLCLPYSPEEYYYITQEDASYIQETFDKREEQTFKWLDVDIDIYKTEYQGRISIMSGWCGMQMTYAAGTEKEFRRMRLLLKGIGEAI